MYIIIFPNCSIKYEIIDFLFRMNMQIPLAPHNTSIALLMK